MLGFIVMHDASHYAISFHPYINRGLHVLWNNWNLWFHFIWLRHHVYAHHSYTGIYRQDPDLVNASLFLRKHPGSRYKQVYKSQMFHVWPLMGIFPNQHLGQSIMYLFGIFYRNIFGIPLEKGIPLREWLLWLFIYIPSLYFHFVFPFHYLADRFQLSFGRIILILLCYWGAQGLGYFANVLPNHDTITTLQNDISSTEKRDWGIQQVLSSANHSTSGGILTWLITHLWGGMNFQIEHHLFPQVSHVYFPEIAVMVRQTCDEFSVKYETQSWAAAIWGFVLVLNVLSNPKIGRSNAHSVCDNVSDKKKR